MLTSSVVILTFLQKRIKQEVNVLFFFLNRNTSEDSDSIIHL